MLEVLPGQARRVRRVGAVDARDTRRALRIEPTHRAFVLMLDDVAVRSDPPRPCVLPEAHRTAASGDDVEELTLWVRTVARAIAAAAARRCDLHVVHVDV